MGGGSSNAFKSGSALPSISNDDKKGAGSSIFNKPKEDQKKFEDDFGDDFEDDFEEDEEEEGEDGDFDANELLNLTDYQNKRKQSQQSATNSN